MYKWQALVFDLDDTLYLEQDYVLGGFQAVAAWAECHLHIPTDQGMAELKQLFEQGVRGDTFNRWLALHQLPSDCLVSQLVQIYREHQPALMPFPEVPKLLKRLHQGYRLGLVSDGYLAVQQRKLAALGLSHYFDVVVFSDIWGRQAWKPSLIPFQVVLQDLDVEAANSVYIADNPTKDFLGARQVGMFTIWVRRNDGEYTHLSPPTTKHAPHLTIVSLSQLDQVFTI